MNLVEFRLEGSEDYRVLCVSSVSFALAHFVSLLRKEGWFRNEEAVVCSRKLEEDAYFFKGSSGLSGVYVRQREVKVYHLTRGATGEVVSL
jgi:hypothetical protein